MRILAAVTITTAIVTSVTSTALAQKVEVDTVTLDNGMTFLLVPRDDQPNTIAAGWLAKVGSVNERPGITGISHFFEHMMFKGTNTIGTRDAKRDADYRAQQKGVRDEINMLTWTDQYGRYFRGEIDDPWNPVNDTPKLKELRAELKTLMDRQQGKAFGDEIAKLKTELAQVGPDSEGAKETTERITAKIASLEAEQSAGASIVKDEFDQVYTKAGGSGMNAFTSHDLTFFFINVPSNKFELWAWMESDRLNDSVFREFYSERDVVHEERRLRTESTPTGTFQEQFDSMFWISSGYSWPVIGWSSDLNSYTIEESQRYWDLYYRPNNLVGIIVGDFNAADIKPVIREYFGRLKSGAQQPPPVITLEHKQVAEMRMKAEVEAQPSVEIRWHAVPFRHRDSYALDVMSSILNGRTGRLYKTMVEGKQIASNAGARTDIRKYAGAFEISAETKGDATPDQLEAAIDEEIKRLQTELVTDRELQKVKNQNAAEQYRRLQSNFFLMIQLAFLESMGGWEEINEENAKIQAVTAADVQRVAQTYFKNENRAVATYLRKQSSGASRGGVAATVADDPEFARLPAAMQPMVRQAIEKLQLETDSAKLKEALARMDQQGDMTPSPMKPAVDYIRRKIEERIQQLDVAAK
ncbi:MAG: pitrilysin family protein [Phycisphaerae bacterium]|nr:pitrilysin family protein [Phycisphaerae bacterium]